MAPSFLKALSRKKSQPVVEDETVNSKARDSNVTQLDGNFAQVSPTESSFPNGKAGAKDTAVTSSSASTHTKDGSSGGGLTGLFRIGSRQQQQPSTSSSASVSTKVEPLQKLSLKETLTQDSTPLLDVFETKSDKEVALDDKTIGETKLTPSETTGLVKPCAQAITLTGLETLGIMHPHWHSALPIVQNRLISIYIQSLSSNYKGPAFDKELQHTALPHDVAAVLRWGIRHLTIESITNAKAGSSDEPWAWYNAFAKAEKSANYPPKAFSELLIPNLRSDVKELLLATLNIMASLAAHAEHNGISGSKLSKVLGFWLLLSGQRVDADKDNWFAFYQKWEEAGRILEHLFLARIREEAVTSRMPTRLLELVAQYPYTKPEDKADGFLSRPVFSTRSAIALYVPYCTTLHPDINTAKKPSRDVYSLLTNALEANFTGTGGLADEWEAIRAKAKSAKGTDQYLSSILSDASIHAIKGASPQQSVQERPSKKVSSSTLAIPKQETIPEEPAQTAPGLSRRETVDWATFTSSGFSTPTKVAPLSAPSSKESEVSPASPPRPSTSTVPRSNSRSRKPSAPTSASSATAQKDVKRTPEPTSETSGATAISVDESFADFFADAALDPVSNTWPRFVIAKLQPLPELAKAAQGKPISWIVIEQVFLNPLKPKVTVETPVASPSSKKNTPTKQPSLSKKRFSLFSSSSTSVNEKPPTPKSPEKPAKHKLKKEHVTPSKTLPAVGEESSKRSVEKTKDDPPKRSIEKLKKEPPPAIKEKLEERARASMEAAAAAHKETEPEVAKPIAEEPAKESLAEGTIPAEKTVEAGSTPSPETALNVSEGYKEPAADVPPPAVEQSLATTGPQVSAEKTEPEIVPIPEAAKTDASDAPVALDPVPIASSADVKPSNGTAEAVPTATET